ncbi:hypothetical protein BVRB_3g057220 [Beta vulgaris subsp. vulgaris]|nr:hypothetical protein BVRB_3g057220 [Beta vulgaris subsp. vulgaris]
MQPQNQSIFLFCEMRRKPNHSFIFFMSLYQQKKTPIKI